MSTSQKLLDELSQPFLITAEHRAFYEEMGYIKLKQVLSVDVLKYYGAIISAIVQEKSANKVPLEQRSTYDKAFLQIENIWPDNDLVREFVFSKRLAQIATELMSCRGVRIYHDQALYKEAGGGITPWHADQYYWPVSNDNTITAWIPLQETPMDMGPLAFCQKSHRLHFGRDLEISDKSEMTLKQALQEFVTDDSPFALGDLSFHAGWTFHRAGANTSDRPREVMTMIYIDEDIRVAQPKNKGQEADRAALAPGIEVGGLFDSPITPVLYSKG